MADINQMIAERAYFKFLQRGGVHGADQKDWLEAEMELNSKPIAGAKKTAASPFFLFWNPDYKPAHRPFGLIEIYFTIAHG